MINSNKFNKAGFAVFVLLFSLLTGVSQAFGEYQNVEKSTPDADLHKQDIAFGEDPNVGKSTTVIYFEEDVNSIIFQIWSAGPGPLNYTLDINGTYADNFTIDANSGKVHGQSTGINDRKTHAVDVNYGQIYDIVLNARIVITENNDTNLVSYITLLAQAPEESNEPNTPDSNPLIGKSTSRIELAGGVTSKKFKIWNKGEGTLDYELAVGGDDADYFFIDDAEIGDFVQGQSEGPDDKKTHTVSVIYDDDFHNDSLNAWIEITDGEGNSSYIELSATETIASRVSYIAIEQGVNFGALAETYDFLFYIDTDYTVEEIKLISPEGNTITLMDADYAENEEGDVRYWTYSEPEADLSNYGDGIYVIEVNYADGSRAQTMVNFGIPNKPGTIAWPTQIPVLISPAFEEQTVSPVRLEWEKCTDPNVNAIRLFLGNEDTENWINKEYGKGTYRSAPIDLETGVWLAELDFGRWYKAANGDGIEYKVGKCAWSTSNFETMKWFGDLDGKNHPLRIVDCEGTEVVFNLTGGGWGEVTGDDCAFDSINLYDTTAKSVFSIKTADGNVTSIGSIETDSDIKAITGRKVDLEGDITIAGGARSIILNNVSGSIGIGSYETDEDLESPKITPCILNFNAVDDLILETDTPIRDLRATEWLAGSIDATWISKMTIKGDFGANVTLSGIDNPKGMSLKSAKIAGKLSSVLDISGNCGTISFASSADSSYAISGNVGTIKATGNKKTGIPAVLTGEWFVHSAKTINAGSIEQCRIWAAGPAQADKPVVGKMAANGWIRNTRLTAIDDIGSISAGAMEKSHFLTTADIGKISNRGINNEAFCFINSSVRAQKIGAASLGYPKYYNGGNSFGLTAGTIGNLTIKDSQSRRTWKNNEIGADGITIGDLKINLK